MRRGGVRRRRGSCRSEWRPGVAMAPSLFPTGYNVALPHGRPLLERPAADGVGPSSPWVSSVERLRQPTTSWLQPQLGTPHMLSHIYKSGSNKSPSAHRKGIVSCSICRRYLMDLCRGAHPRPQEQSTGWS